MDVAALRRYRQIRRNDFTSSTAALIGCAALRPALRSACRDRPRGARLVYRSSRIDLEIMGKVPGREGRLGGIRDHPETKDLTTGILVIRLDSRRSGPTPPRSPTALAEVEQQDDRPGGFAGPQRHPNSTPPASTRSNGRDRLATKGWSCLVRVFCHGPTGSQPVRLRRKPRRGPHVAQHLGRGAGGEEGLGHQRQGAPTVAR